MKEKKSKLFSLVTIFLLTVICVISVSYAWFIYNDKIVIQNSTEVSVSNGNYLQVSYLKSDGTWSQYGESISFASETLTDVTSDGITVFYPESLSSTDQPNMDIEMATISSEEKTGFYIEMYFRIKCNNKLSVYLSNQSYLWPRGISSQEEDDETNKHTEFQISRNYIAGATRVSFCEVERDASDSITNETLKTIWIPNETYQLNYYNNNPAFTKTGNMESNYKYLTNGTNNTVEVTYNTDDYLNKVLTIGELADQATNLSNNSCEILTFDKNNEEQVKEISIRIWIEGTDREADSLFSGGQFNCNIVFCAMRKSSDSAEQIALMNSIKPIAEDGILYYVGDTNTAVSLDDEIQYSYNGKTWSDYNVETGLPNYYITPTEENPEPTQTTQTVYIRKKETTSGKNETICKLDLKTLTNTIWGS